MLEMITLIYYCHFVKGHLNTRKEGDYDLREKGLTFPEHISWPSYINITPCPLLRLNVLFCSNLNQWKVLHGNPRTYCVPKEWGQRIPWCRLWKWLGPHLGRLVGKSLRDKPTYELRGSNRKTSASWQLTSSAVPSAQPWERHGGGRSAHPLPHCLLAFPAWSSFSSRWQNTHIENSKATQGLCLLVGLGYDFFKS